MEDVPAQSCRRHRRDGPVRCADNLVPSALWFVDHGAWQTTGHMVRSNNASDREMDRKPDNGSLRLGAASMLSDARSRGCIRRDIYPPRSIDRHSRPPDVSAFTLAKRIRRTVDRLDPHGMPRSYRGVRRTPSAPCAAILHGLLQWHAHSLIVEQGRADITCRRGRGAHSVPSDPGWTASPICSGLICGRHRRMTFQLRCCFRFGSCLLNPPGLRSAGFVLSYAISIWLK